MMRSIGGAVFGHAVENDAGVEGGAFDGGEQFILRRAGEMPTESDAAQFRIDENGAIAVVPGHAQQAGLAGAVIFETARECSARSARAASDGVEDVADSGKSGFDAGHCGSTEPGTTPQTPGTRLALSLRPMMQVDVPITLTTSPSSTPAPMASQ